MDTWEIAGHTLEYIDALHQYIVDGICVPSITQLLKIKFGQKYAGISAETLQNAADKGIRVHEAIEKFEKYGIIDKSCKELKNYKFLKKLYKFECLDNEVPIILFDNEIPVAAGRLDLCLKINNEFGLADIKRTAVLDREYIGYQLNLYRIGYKQCYGIDINFLKGIK